MAPPVAIPIIALKLNGLPTLSTLVQNRLMAAIASTGLKPLITLYMKLLLISEQNFNISWQMNVAMAPKAEYNPPVMLRLHVYFTQFFNTFFGASPMGKALTRNATTRNSTIRTSMSLVMMRMTLSNPQTIMLQMPPSTEPNAPRLSGAELPYRLSRVIRIAPSPVEESCVLPRLASRQVPPTLGISKRQPRFAASAMSVFWTLPLESRKSLSLWKA